MSSGLLPKTPAERLARLEYLVELLQRMANRSRFIALDELYRRTLIGRRLRCIVCGNEEVRERLDMWLSECQFQGGTLERYRCRRCGALFGPMKMLDMSESELEDDYHLLYETYAEGDSTDAELRTFSSLDPHPGQLYLNWGSGSWSKSIPTLRSRGFDVYGYEPMAERTENFIVRHRGEISARFDGIFSNNVIEHFTDPIAQFRDFASILKPGAVMAHSTPCYEYRCHNSRFHTVFYLDDSINVLARETGFEIIGREVDGDYINVVFRKRTSDSVVPST
jgi:SAM-dependent methyltransferase